MVLAPDGTIGFHLEDTIGKLPLKVDLSSNAVKQGGKGLVNGIEGDGAVEFRVDVDVEFGVSGKGKEQILDGCFMNNNGVTL